MQEAPAVAVEGNPCAGVDCTKPASNLSCPTCVKLGITTSKFCDQDCFKRNWPTHKAVHAKAQQEQTVVVNGVETYDPFPSRVYTGTLRARYQKNKRYNARDPLQRRHVPAHIPRPNYADDVNGDPKYNRLESRGAARPKELESWEQEGMRRACKLAREVLDHAASCIRPGITSDELDAIVHKATIDRNSYPSPLNYRNFPKSCCISVNEVICHGIPDLRPLEEGDIVNLDISLYHGGFHADLNGTYPVGKIDADSERLLKAARESLDAAIAMVKPGTLFRDFGATIEKVANSYGCSVNRTYCGHGINSLFHPAPSIPHYAKNKAPHYCKPGMTFTIEPMLCLGDQQEVHWPDDWTAVTRDGKRSAQFEETLLVTETGVEILTKAPDAQADGVATNGSASSETAVDSVTKKVDSVALAA